MPKRGRKPGEQTFARTRVAQLRVYRGMTQEEVAEAAGISLSAYRAIERGKNDNPQLGVIANIAYVLGYELVDAVDPDWLDWTYWPTSSRNPVGQKPDDPRALWREHRDDLRRADQMGLAKKRLPAPPDD
jgi:transcriptional regulator with XRE-family HTH domain